MVNRLLNLTWQNNNEALFLCKLSNSVSRSYNFIYFLFTGLKVAFSPMNAH